MTSFGHLMALEPVATTSISSLFRIIGLVDRVDPVREDQPVGQVVSWGLTAEIQTGEPEAGNASPVVR